MTNAGIANETLNQMYATYRDNCPDTQALPFEDWYKDYYLDDVWVCGSLAASDHYDVADKKPVKMPYDKHDAELVIKSLNALGQSVKAGWITEKLKKDYMHDNLIRDYSNSDLDQKIALITTILDRSRK